MIWQKFTIIIFLGIFLCFNNSSAQQEPGQGNNQVISSRDAIGLRVIPNPEHFSPLQWYNKNIKIKGSPQLITVDDYEAVRDGRTVYVNAAKIVQVKRCNGTGNVCTQDSQCGVIPDPGIYFLPKKFVPQVLAASCEVSNIPELYTNIYIISYNQDPEPSTTDIFGQILQYWKFNIDIKNCSKTVTQACSEAGGAGGGCPVGEVCQATGQCNQTTDKACLIDSDCPEGEFCNSKKSTIVRDTLRLSQLRDIKDKLEAYNTNLRHYPALESGTYLTNRTVSTWPSWLNNLSTTLGFSLPIDKINKLGKCRANDNENARFDPMTCWDEVAKEFAGTADPLTMPAGSRVYYYQYKPVDNSFRFCTIVESGYIHGMAPMSIFCATGRSCNRNCTNKQCGDDGCGGSCGTCAAGYFCQNGNCRNIYSPD